MRNLGRGLGVVAGAATTLIWVYAIYFPSGGLTISGVSIVVAALMGLLGLFVAIASVKGHAPVLFVAFVASFLPVGAYMLGVDHWLRLVGILDMLILTAGLLLWASSRRERA
jgi:hypothetical protein